MVLLYYTLTANPESKCRACGLRGKAMATSCRVHQSRGTTANRWPWWWRRPSPGRSLLQLRHVALRLHAQDGVQRARSGWNLWYRRVQHVEMSRCTCLQAFPPRWCPSSRGRMRTKMSGRTFSRPRQFDFLSTRSATPERGEAAGRPGQLPLLQPEACLVPKAGVPARRVQQSAAPEHRRA